jgi:hypothetical protein
MLAGVEEGDEPVKIETGVHTNPPNNQRNKIPSPMFGDQDRVPKSRYHK